MAGVRWEGTAMQRHRRHQDAARRGAWQGWSKTDKRMSGRLMMAEEEEERDPLLEEPPLGMRVVQAVPKRWRRVP